LSSVRPGKARAKSGAGQAEQNRVNSFAALL